MTLAAALALTACSGLDLTSGGCPTERVGPAVDLIDQVRTSEGTYITFGGRVPDDQTGPLVTRTRCRLQDGWRGGEMVPGDATFLLPGTPLHEVLDCRGKDALAALVDGDAILYVALEDLPRPPEPVVTPSSSEVAHEPVLEPTSPPPFDQEAAFTRACG